MEDDAVAVHRLEALRRASAGLNGAVLRLTRSDHSNHFAPLTEFCWWVISLDEGLELIRGRKNYQTARDGDPDGQVVAGLRFVRNALGHERLIVTRTEGGLSLPITLPLSMDGPKVAWWVDADIVVIPKPQPDNRENYRKWVAGRRVDETVLAARRWVEGQVEHLNRESGYYS